MRYLILAAACLLLGYFVGGLSQPETSPTYSYNQEMVFAFRHQNATYNLAALEHLNNGDIAKAEATLEASVLVELDDLRPCAEQRSLCSDEVAPIYKALQERYAQYRKARTPEDQIEN